MLNGKHGRATRKAMEILFALGTIYHAERLIPVSSVQIAGVSYDNLGEAGLEFLDELVEGGAHTRILATLNPAGMDIENWQRLGISEDFAQKQNRVIESFFKMGVITTCTCTPYLSGNLPLFGEHIAWSESSAVCYANSVIGARTNREGGPSALAAALTGRTPEYGLHLSENRIPALAVRVEANLSSTYEFGALGIVLGKYIEKQKYKPVPWISGISAATGEDLKSLCASIATYGGTALVHIDGITPEANSYRSPGNGITIDQKEIDAAIQSVRTADPDDNSEVDFVSLGCPHLSLKEIQHIAELLKGKKVVKTFWITTSRPIKFIADQMGYTRTIEEAGAIFAADTCCVVAPIKGRFKVMATDSAKACYYASAKNKFRTLLLPFDDVVKQALS